MRYHSALARLLIVVAAGAVAGATAPASAFAEGSLISALITSTGAATVDGTSEFRGNDQHIEVVRGGTLVARSTGSNVPGRYGSVQVPSLLAGDVINLVRDGRAFTGVTFDGTPTINADACAGRSTFTGTRSGAAKLDYAGAFTPGVGPYGDDTRAIWSQDNPFTVTVDRPLRAGQVAYAATVHFATPLPNVLEFDVERDITVGACPSSPPPPVPAPVPPTDAQVAQAVNTALAATAKQLRALNSSALAKKKSVALAFTLPEAGAVTLRLTTKSKSKTVVVGTGKKAGAAGSSVVTVKLTSAGRKLLKRAKALKLTVKATFDPTRAGAKTQSASTSVTVKRKKK